MFCQIFLSPEVKRWAIITYKYVRVASPVAERIKTQDLRRLGNNRKVSKRHRMIDQCPVFLSKRKFCQRQEKCPEKQQLKFACVTLFHMKTRVSLKYFITDCSFLQFCAFCLFCLLCVEFDIIFINFITFAQCLFIQVSRNLCFCSHFVCQRHKKLSTVLN